MSEPLHRLAAALRADGGLLAAATRDPAPEAEARMGPLAASGPRTRANREDYAPLAIQYRSGANELMADRRETKSKYTADRQLPGAFEGETVTRRRFMTGTAHGLGAIAGAAFTLPALGFALGPLFEREKAHWVP